jgi:hypothetical protein
MKLFRDVFRIFWLPGAVFLLDELFLYTTNRYDRLPWLDIPMHFIGGAAVSYSYAVFLGLLEERRRMGAMHRAVKILFIVSLVALTAVVWEWHEFLRTIFLGEQTQLGEADTMGDFFMGILGGLVGAAFLTRKKP